MTLTSQAHDHRFLPLAGTLNTRDLGGLPVAGGKQTLKGRFLRSDAPFELTESDLVALADLPLTTVVDLRQEMEIQRDVSRLTGRPGIAVHNIAVWGPIEEADDEPTDKFDITAFYIAALNHAPKAFAQITRILTDAEGAALFHCTAGKDRTGLVALLLLESVGVDRQTIIDDFALTHDRIEPLRVRLLADAEQRGIPRAEFARLLGATPDLLTPALDHLDKRFGGAVQYLSAAGVSDDTFAALERKLVG